MGLGSSGGGAGFPAPQGPASRYPLGRAPSGDCLHPPPALASICSSPLPAVGSPELAQALCIFPGQQRGRGQPSVGRWGSSFTRTFLGACRRKSLASQGWRPRHQRQPAQHGGRQAGSAGLGERPSSPKGISRKKEKPGAQQRAEGRAHLSADEMNAARKPQTSPEQPAGGPPAVTRPLTRTLTRWMSSMRHSIIHSTATLC